LDVVVCGEYGLEEEWEWEEEMEDRGLEMHGRHGLAASSLRVKCLMIWIEKNGECEIEQCKGDS
jgi:hypothetical protein